jgi:hypothetical protein
MFQSWLHHHYVEYLCDGNPSIFMCKHQKRDEILRVSSVILDKFLNSSLK